MPAAVRVEQLVRQLGQQPAGSPAAAVGAAGGGYKALVVSKEGKAPASMAFTEIGGATELPLPAEGADVTVRVRYSTINYKDGMVLGGLPGVATFPVVPGIDLAGEVLEAAEGSGFAAGDAVVMTGGYAGQQHDGGFAQLARLKSTDLVALPAGLSLAQSMAIGTAGFTAMQCVMHLEEAGALASRKAEGPVLVTGAAGGVGCLAVALLSSLGYQVTASSGRAEAHGGWLSALGATEVIHRLPKKGPLQRESYIGVVDTVGGDTLANALAQLKYKCAAAACGVASGPALETTVFPFILRGIRLLGVDSVLCHMTERQAVWARLQTDLELEKLALATTTTAGLATVPTLGAQILEGAVQGRVVIDLDLD